MVQFAKMIEMAGELPRIHGQLFVLERQFRAKLTIPASIRLRPSHHYHWNHYHSPNLRRRVVHCGEHLQRP